MTKDLKSTYNDVAKDWSEDHKNDTWWIAGTVPIFNIVICVISKHRRHRWLGGEYGHLICFLKNWRRIGKWDSSARLCRF